MPVRGHRVSGKIDGKDSLMKRYPRMGFAHRGGQSLPQTLTAALLVAVLSLPGSVRAGDPAMPKPSDKRYAVKTYRNLTYHNVPRDPDRKRHQLDVFQPKGRTGCPVLFFVHGGGWVIGGKDDVFGIYGYGTIARCLAQRGFVVVLPNYRLSPRVRHPEHIKDVARAFAWLYRNVARYGGNPERLFVAGHSAGAHLAALLATDESYLKAEGLTLANIRGVITLSGVFEIPDHNALFDHAFGIDPKIRRAASPTWQVNHWSDLAAVKKAPPFVITYADDDFASCGKEPAQAFARALRAKGCSAQLLEIPHRNHLTILMNASGKDDPAGKALIEFIHIRCRDDHPRGSATEKKHGT